MSMKKSSKFIEKLEKGKNKRVYHQKYNYLNTKDIEKYITQLNEKTEIKLKYDDEILKGSKLYEVEDINILEIDNKYIIIRKDEKSFFFNTFILEVNEYNNKNKTNKLSLLDYIKTISNFIVLDNKNYIILDTENDYILKS